MSTKVTLLLRGLLVLDARENAEEGRVGILQTRPRNHDLIIQVTRKPPSGPPRPDRPIERGQIKDSLLLDIVEPDNRKIRIRNNRRVNRKDRSSNPDSFYWFVDLERADEMYADPVGTFEDQLRPLLTFNSGELYTAQISDNFLNVFDPPFPLPREFGHVAVTLGIDFVSKSAVFKNGNHTVIDSEAEPGFTYTIELTHDAKDHPSIVTDANFYHTALGSNIPLFERKLFLSVSALRVLEEKLEQADKGDEELVDQLRSLIELLRRRKPAAGPEAACFSAFLSKTSIP